MFANLLAEANVQGVFAAEDFSPYARQRDALIARRLPLTLINSLTVHHPSTVCKANGEPYTVFTPFSRAWKALPQPNEHELLPAPAHLPPLPKLASYELPYASSPTHFLSGEANARATLRAFVGQPIFAYSEGRNRLDGDGTSALSPYLRFGMISAREVVAAAQQAIDSAPHEQARQSAEAWLNELIWREFYSAILYHFPAVLQNAFKPKLRAIAWHNDPQAFAVWCDGRTGYPVVDAAMRAYAAKYGEDPDCWGLAGLLHDFDWEIHPTLDEHPQAGVPILRERGVPEDLIRCIQSHAPLPECRARSGWITRSLRWMNSPASSPRVHWCGPLKACTTSRPKA